MLWVMDVFAAIENRRSIKPLDLSDRPVSREIIQQVLEAANWAPSHRHTEPWRFKVYLGDARTRLAEVVVSTLSANEASKAKTTVTKMTHAPVVIAIICHQSPLPKVIPHEEIASTAMAVQNLHLAARALELGGFWSSGKKAFHENVSEFLELEFNEQCLGFFYLGYPAVDWPKGSRGKIEDKVEWFEE